VREREKVVKRDDRKREKDENDPRKEKLRLWRLVDRFFLSISLRDVCGRDSVFSI
jgi:hypothetical protein